MKKRIDTKRASVPEWIQSAEMAELNRDIVGYLAMARDYLDYEQIAKAIGLDEGTLANKRSAKELPLLRFWQVAEIVRLAGYKIVYRKD